MATLPPESLELVDEWGVPRRLPQHPFHQMQMGRQGHLHDTQAHNARSLPQCRTHVETCHHNQTMRPPPDKQHTSNTTNENQASMGAETTGKHANRRHKGIVQVAISGTRCALPPSELTLSCAASTSKTPYLVLMRPSLGVALAASCMQRGFLTY